MTDQPTTPENPPADTVERPTGRTEADAPAPSRADRDASSFPADHATGQPSGSGAGVLGWARGRGRWVAAGGLAVLLALGVGAAGYSVGAAGDAGTSQTPGDGRHGNRGDDEGNRNAGSSGEVALTGAVLDEVTSAVDTAYPDSTIVEVETDSDGVYEAHIVTEDGQEVTVELDEDYEITGTEED